MTENHRDHRQSSSSAEVLAGLRETTAWQERLYEDLHAGPEPSFQETGTAAPPVREKTGRSAAPGMASTTSQPARSILAPSLRRGYLD